MGFYQIACIGCKQEFMWHSSGSQICGECYSNSGGGFHEINVIPKTGPARYTKYIPYKEAKDRESAIQFLIKGGVDESTIEDRIKMTQVKAIKYCREGDSLTEDESLTFHEKCHYIPDFNVILVDGSHHMSGWKQYYIVHSEKHLIKEIKDFIKDIKSGKIKNDIEHKSYSVYINTSPKPMSNMSVGERSGFVKNIKRKTEDGKMILEHRLYGFEEVRLSITKEDIVSLKEKQELIENTSDESLKHKNEFYNDFQIKMEYGVRRVYQ